MTDTPSIFRISIEVSDMPKAVEFYTQLLGIEGRNIRGSRHYFDCGSVILALVDVSQGGQRPRPIPGDLFFAVKDLDKVYARAGALNCLSSDEFHEQKGGEITVRPWGERSFYVRDPYGNGICFVDENTLFTGR